MTKRDLLRLQTAQRVLDGAVSVAEAAADLGLSTRQIKRLTRRLRVDGAAAFRSARASKPPNNAFDPAVRELVLERVRTHPWRNTPLTPRQVQLSGGHL